MKKHLFTLALVLLASLSRVQADTSYLLIQGPFGSGGAPETFKWQVNYQPGQLETGFDLITTVFGTPTPDGTFPDIFGGPHNLWTAGNSTQGIGIMDFANGDGILESPFIVSLTLNSTQVTSDVSLSPGWTSYVAGGGSNQGNGYDNGVWSFSQDGLLSRTLVDGSYDAWVYGITFGDSAVTVDGVENDPVAPNFAGATVINVPEPSSAMLLIVGGAGFATAFNRRRVVRRSVL
jgi:hypothetical protein